MEEKTYKSVKAVVFEGINKNGKKYRMIRVKIGDYTLPDTIWVNGPIAYLLNQAEQGK